MLGRRLYQCEGPTSAERDSDVVGRKVSSIGEGEQTGKVSPSISGSRRITAIALRELSLP